MFFKSGLILAATIVGLTNAACTFTGYNNADCTGGSGSADALTSTGRCINLTGRAAYKLSSDCGTVRVEGHTGSGCTGSIPDANDLIAGCHQIGPGDVSAYVYTH
ncbi:hypothetical protein F4824DRAFT_498868 [Ustulina deusta]|nr:hypothetical protein F4823DRAFT_562691 [Ustulina deusta]KAI3339013.1 hypothetical protein F4824DRAFT_498868 [Ustulina deusta]